VKIPLNCIIRLTAALARGASLLALGTAGLALLGAFPSQGQPPGPSAPARPAAFEVASIKPTPPTVLGKRIAAPGNRLILDGLSLKELIRLAYGPGGGSSLPPDLVGGGPNWIDDVRYDVEARAEGNATQQQRLEMLRTLLAERFKLRFHYESKETAAYVLAVGKNGLKLKERKPGDDGEPFTIRDMGSLHFVCRDISMARLAMFLESSVLARPVAEKTGLSGTFDFDLSWRPDDSQFGGRFARAKEAESDLPDLFTALRQLGLRLDAVKAPVQFLRIDHAEKPSEN
jgi:uncharacterized protein (TIGR03435 family)